jgi:two-component system sensor kinase FixL
MGDTRKTRGQLMQEVAALRQRVAQLEAMVDGCRQLDSMLREERQFVSAVLETVSALIVVLDRQGRIVRFNRACERTTGYSFDDVKGKYFWDLFLIPEEIEQVKAVFEALRAGQCQRPRENFWVTKDGQRRLISWSNTSLRDPAGLVLYIIGTGIDVTERKQAEQAVQERQARLRAILDTAVDGIITIDEQGMIESFNAAAERIFGYAAHEVLGQNVTMLMPSSYREAHQNHLARYLETGEKQIIGADREVVGLRKDGTTFPMHIAIKDVSLSGHRLFTGVMRDLTEHKQTQQELQRADRLALVGQMASGLAHEVGTPLNVIEGNAELLRMELRKQNIPTAELDTIIEQTDRITRLINRLLTFARAKAQPMEALSLHTPLSHALRLLETRFQREAISVIVDMSANLPLVRGTPDGIEQVFLNILINAWHAMPQGGTVTIVGKKASDSQVQIVFRDSGCGMSPEELQQAFEPFYTTKGERGTGLGLAICKQIIDNHRGTISLHSIPENGTTVTITFPQVDDYVFTTQTEQEA